MKKFASVQNRVELEQTTEALVDCYGKLPDAARRLATVHRLRLKCEQAGIRKIDAGDKAILITFLPATKIEPMALIRFLQSRTDARMAGEDRLRIERSSPDAEKRADMVEDFIEELLNPVESRAPAAPPKPAKLPKAVSAGSTSSGASAKRPAGRASSSAKGSSRIRRSKY